VIAMVWSVIVLVLIALIGGAIVGLIAAFGINAVVEVARGVSRRSARR
jgi:hypothetical protein